MTAIQMFSEISTSRDLHVLGLIYEAITTHHIATNADALVIF
jgi:hypothetical protein